MKRYLILVVVIGALVAFAGCAKKAAQTSAGQSRQAAPSAGGNGTFAQFRESHKYTFMLTRMVANIGELDADTDAPLTQEQAKTILATLEPLQKQPTLTQDQAKEAAGKLKAALTAKQLTEMGKMREPERRPQGPGPGMGQSGPGQGQQPAFDMSAMKDFNPFNPSGGNPMAGRQAKRMAAFFTALKAKAKT